MKYIDLHNHLDGSLPPETILELAKMSGVTLPAETVDAIEPYLTVSPGCTSLNEYLEKFSIPVSLLQSEACLEKAVYDTLADLAKRDVVYAELRFAPGQHLKQGLTQMQVTQAAVNGLNKAVANCPISAQLILCCMRGADEAVNRTTIDVTKAFLGKGVCCADLAGAEALFPTSDYRNLFQYAAGQGVPYVIHAGEAAGPESMWAAIEMGAKRIGHGIAAVQDPALMEHLKQTKTPLEVCVTSNVQTKGVASPAEHPLIRMLEFGLHVTVNTDNMTVSGTDLHKEYALAETALHMTELQKKQLLEYSIRAAFLTDTERQQLRSVVFG